MKTYNKSITKMERAFLEQGLEHNKKAFAGFYLTLKAHKLKPGQNVTHLKSRPIIACPGSLLHPLGIWTDLKLQALQNNKYHISRTATTSVKKYALHNTIQQHSSSPPMPSQCTQTYRPTLPSCSLQNTFIHQYPKNDLNKMKH